jgi:hypothetical protein
MSDTDNSLRAELERLRSENEALKAKKTRALSLKISEKGAISVYGLRAQWPVTLYREEMERMLDFAPTIQEFIKANAGKLSNKPV